MLDAYITALQEKFARLQDAIRERDLAIEQNDLQNAENIRRYAIIPLKDQLSILLDRTVQVLKKGNAERGRQ